MGLDEEDHPGGRGGAFSDALTNRLGMLRFHARGKTVSGRKIYGKSSDVLLVCLVMCFALTILILGVPLFVRRKDLRGDRQLGSALLYFGCLGLGFMAIELPTIQIMTLFLGHPTYALGVVLLGLLAAAGTGSVLIGRLPIAPVGRRSSLL